ncbi:MAG: ABC transporter ATP-binding protein/permease [bacterium]|nr:ABC transporter ATP-binding protein/permease [bacterium]
MTTSQSYRKLLGLLKPHKTGLFIGLSFAIVANSLDAVGPYILKQAFDTIGKEFVWLDLWKWAGLLVVLAVIRGVFRYHMRMKVIGVSRDAEYDLRTNYFDKLMRLPAQFFDRNRTGDLMSRATSDIENVRQMIGPAVMYLANTIVTLLFSITIMFMLAPSLTLYVLLLIPIVAVVIGWLGQEDFKRTDALQEKTGELSAAVQENLSGARVIRSYAQEHREVERLDVHNREYYKRAVSVLRFDGSFQTAMGIIFSGGFVAILWIGGNQLADGKISLGTFVAFTTYLGLLAWPMIAIGWVANLIQRGLASWQRIMTIMETPDEPDTGTVDTAITGSVMFKSVSLRYTEDREPALTSVSFTIPEGGSLGIVGRTGSGKSSLAALIPRLYPPTSGTVEIDGIPVEKYRLSTLRGSIGFVPQEAFLFSTTIAGNIAFADPTKPTESIVKVSEMSALSNDIEQLEDGYNTLVGERGVTLSGGQKQRTAIARALLTDPKILILDDPLANVDTATERAILTSLEQFMRGRTTILIAHRASTVMNCDNVLVLSNGVVVEYGSPTVLLERNGEFSELFERQRITEELAEVA